MSRLTPAECFKRVEKWRALGLAPQWSTEEVGTTASDAQAFRDQLASVEQVLTEIMATPTSEDQIEGVGYIALRRINELRVKLAAMLTERP